MLEIILLIFLCSAIGKMARARGRTAGGYQFMLVMFWIIGEVLGFIMGLALTEGGRGDAFLLLVMCALVGAACGAGLAFLIVGSLPSVNDQRDDYRREYERDFERSSEGYHGRGDRDSERERWNTGRPEGEDVDERYRREG
jgi:hypothetical protein